jgi:phage gpG-like protein
VRVNFNTSNAESVLSDRIDAKLEVVGQWLEDEVGLNIRRQGLVDSSKLLNSRFHRMVESGRVRIGVVAVYAAIHEFGGIIKQVPTELQKRFFFRKAYEEQGSFNRQKRREAKKKG